MWYVLDTRDKVWNLDRSYVMKRPTAVYLRCYARAENVLWAGQCAIHAEATDRIIPVEKKIGEEIENRSLKTLIPVSLELKFVKNGRTKKSLPPHCTNSSQSRRLSAVRYSSRAPSNSVNSHRSEVTHHYFGHASRSS